MTDADGGTIVTFYSYKGGTGRSMALANVGWILASNGKRVLVVDWDLDSPGLHRYFHPFLVDKRLQTSRGTIDLIWDFQAEAMDPHGDNDGDWVRQVARIERYAVSLEWNFGKNATLDFVPAGRQDAAYSNRVSEVDWNTLYANQGGARLFEQLRADMKANYDYVLIDSRTGLSDSAGICTKALPDLVVDCFTMNAQSLEGAVDAAHSIRDPSGLKHPIRVLPVPMRIEDAEQGKLEAGRDYFRRVFAPFLSHLDHASRERYWGEIEVPYKPYYAYEEILATIGERPLQEGTLLAAYERVTSAITGGAVSELVPMDEADRRTWLEMFERKTDPAPSDIFISHVEQDRMWADWIAYHLTRAGYRVTTQGSELAPGADLATALESAISSTACTLAVMTPDYLESASAITTWDVALSRDRSAAPGLFVPIQVAKFRLWGRFASRVPVMVEGLDDDSAVDELLAAVRSLEPSGLRTETPDQAPRYPGSEPIVSDIPSRNPHFVGRDALLLEIRQRLLNDTTAVVVPQALHGLGGVGKTQVALEYAHRFGADYDVVWWVPAEQPAEARAKLAALAPLLDAGMAEAASDEDVGDTARQVRAALDALRRGTPFRKWLLIFDNAEDPAELESLIPSGSGSGHVIVTTRNQDWANEAKTVEVDVFTRPESLDLLRRRGREMSAEDSDRLADRLGDLPLALEQAAVWHSETGMPVAEYLELFDQRLDQLMHADSSDQYPLSVAATWSIVFDRLRIDALASVQLLELCAFFGPEPIPFRLLKFGQFANLPQPLATTIADSIQRRRAVREIGRYALAKVDPGPDTLQVHRLVQAVLRSSLSEEDKAVYLASAHELIALANPGSPDTRKNWPQHAELSPHIGPAKLIAGTNELVRKVVLDQVRYRYRRGDIEGSSDLAQQARTYWQQHLPDGPDDQQTLVASRYLADSLRWLGQYTEAREINDDTIERLERLLGPDHEHTLATQNSRGGDLRLIGRFEEARQLDEQNLERHRRVYGDDAPDTLKSQHNLAVDLRLLGDFQAALELDETTLRGRRRVLDPEDSYILSSTVNLARDTMFLGDSAGARSMLSAILSDFRRVLPSDHIELLSASRAYSVSLRMAGDYDTARRVSEENLVQHRDRLGTDHQLTLDVMITVGNNRRAVGDLDGALSIYEETLDRSQRTLGDDHPFTQAAAVNLAVIQRAQGGGSLTLARELTASAWTTLQRTLGEDHFFTLTALANTATDHALAGDFHGARVRSEQAFEKSRLHYGPDHPDTLGYALNLSIDLRESGGSGAERLLVDTLSRMQRVLGEDHPVAHEAQLGRRAEFDIETPPT